MLTKSDLQAIRIVVKEEIKEETKHLTTKDELRATENRLVEKITVFKDEILGEMETLREDNTVLTSHGDQLANHEDRISVLEKSSLSHLG